MNVIMECLLVEFNKPGRLQLALVDEEIEPVTQDANAVEEIYPVYIQFDII